jgi:hypothetical protein
MPKTAALHAGRESLAVVVSQLREILTKETPALIDRYTVANGLPHSTPQFQMNVIRTILAKYI